MMVSPLVFILFVCGTACIHALLEIEIEGKHGWAQKLPTRKIQNTFTKRFTENGYITGFHFLTIILITVFAHLPLLYVSGWSLKLEIGIIAFIMLHLTLEDIFWFALNPHFGLRKLNKKNVSWHKVWIGNIPFGYWIGGIVGCVLLILAYV